MYGLGMASHIALDLLTLVIVCTETLSSSQRSDCNARRVSDFIQFTMPPLSEHTDFVKQPLNRCALVGAAASLMHKGHGPKIDAHDVVIRVNRLPTLDYFEDFGKRTDVLVLAVGKENDWGISLMGGKQRDEFGKLEELRIICRYGGPNCTFSSLLFLYHQVPYDSTLLTAPFPVGVSSRASFLAAYCLVPESKHPSTGLHAFLTFAPLCRTLSLFGFSGQGTADGHHTSSIHNYDVEHSLQARIEARNLTKADVRMTRRTAFLEMAFQNEPIPMETLDWIRDHVIDADVEVIRD